MIQLEISLLTFLRFQVTSIRLAVFGPAWHDFRLLMFHNHLPQFASHVLSAGRNSFTFLHAMSRAFVVSLYGRESPLATFEAVIHEAERKRKARKRFPPLLVHFHIFKNAGSSFERALWAGFGKKRVFRCDTSSIDGFVSAREMRERVRKKPKIAAVITHQAVPPAPRIPGREVTSSILIRDPIARIRSIYSYERAFTEEYEGSIKAKELGFKDYVEWRLAATPRLLCDFQVHFCCRPESDHDHGRPSRSDLERAIKALDRIDLVGTVERYDEWLALVNSVVGESFDGISVPSTRINVLTGDRCKSKEAIYNDLVKDLGENLFHYLLDHNQLDISLYQVADALLSRRLAERGLHFALRHTYLEISSNRALTSSSLG